jgi:YfiH family protein
MLKTNTKIITKAQQALESSQLTNSAIELVNWPSISSLSPLFQHLAPINEKIFALQTNRGSSSFVLPQKLSEQISTTSFSTNEPCHKEAIVDKKSPFGYFNLGFHVGDSAKKVSNNRNQLREYISQHRSIRDTTNNSFLSDPIKIQWLEQVHGNQVAEITTVSNKPITADASITRQKNIALAIMTADCLPILLTNSEGTEIAAIHGGWRPLAASIIEQTLNKMVSEASDIIAWLGPCIGKDAFEVGREVRDNFVNQNKVFDEAFVKQKSGKYFANLPLIARLQLTTLGVSAISVLAECTYQNTDKYYSYRKEQLTGRMASIICIR